MAALSEWDLAGLFSGAEVSLLGKEPPEELRQQYMQPVLLSRMRGTELAQCKSIDMSRLRGGLARGLRAANRMAPEEGGGLFLQIHPSNRWRITVGLLGELPEDEKLTQDELYFAQEVTLECCACPEAENLFFRCAGAPWEAAVKRFLIADTLLELRAALAAAPVAAALYFGVAHSALWARLDWGNHAANG